MSKKFQIFGALTLLLFNLTAQVCPSPTRVQDLVCDYSDWDWEEPSNCENWNARISTSPSWIVLPNPFTDNVGTRKMNLIRESGDYTKAEGWEVLLRDFGCASNANYPYFVLYNKYSGMMRVFLYLNTLNGETANGFVMTLKYGGVGKFSPYNSFANELVYTPEEYSSNNLEHIKEVEKSYYIGTESEVNQGNWIVGEFFPAYFDDVASVEYRNTQVIVDVFAIKESSIEATIAGESVTRDLIFYGKEDEIEEKTEVEGLTETKFKSIAATSKQVVDGASSVVDALYKEIQKQNNTDQTSSFQMSYKYKDLALKLTSGSEAQGKSDLSKLLNGLSKGLELVPGIAGVLGGVMGLFTKEPEVIEPTRATYTKYDLSVSGTITTETPLTSFAMFVPGIDKTSNTNSAKPYYDCPNGVANLINTAELKHIRYERKVADLMSLGDFYDEFDIYQIENDLTFSVNEASGYKVDFVKVALQSNRPRIGGRIDFVDDPTRCLYGECPEYYYNIVQANVESGIVDRIMEVTDTVGGVAATREVMSTPFVDLERARGTTFEIGASEDEVYLTVVARLVNQEDPDKVYLFARSYKTNTISSTTASRRGFFDPSPIESRTLVIESFDGDADQGLSYFSYPDANNSSGLVASARGALSVSYGNFNSSSSYFELQGGRQVKLKYFEARKGSKLKIRHNAYKESLQKLGGTVLVVSPIYCSYNSSATNGRVADNNPLSSQEIVDEQKPFLIYPNAADYSFKLSAASNGKVRLMSLSGTMIMEHVIKKETEAEFDISTIPAGIYIVEFQDELGRRFIQRLLVR